MPGDLPDKPLRGKTGKFRPRITARIKEVIRLMTEEALPRAEAAQRAGITDDAVQRAMKKKHVRAAYNQAVADVRENAAQKAYLKIARLSDAGDSQRLQFDASRWIAGVDGIAPVQKVEGRHMVNHSFAGFEYPTIDVTPGDAQDLQSGDDGEKGDD
jgi:predicted DNA-binding protein (UPF0251 family)